MNCLKTVMYAVVQSDCPVPDSILYIILNHKSHTSQRAPVLVNMKVLLPSNEICDVMLLTNQVFL